MTGMVPCMGMVWCSYYSSLTGSLRDASSLRLQSCKFFSRKMRLWRWCRFVVLLTTFCSAFPIWIFSSSGFVQLKKKRLCRAESWICASSNTRVSEGKLARSTHSQRVWAGFSWEFRSKQKQRALCWKGTLPHQKLDFIKIFQQKLASPLWQSITFMQKTNS